MNVLKIRYGGSEIQIAKPPEKSGQAVPGFFESW